MTDKRDRQLSMNDVRVIQHSMQQLSFFDNQGNANEDVASYRRWWFDALNWIPKRQVGFCNA